MSDRAAAGRGVLAMVFDLPGDDYDGRPFDEVATAWKAAVPEALRGTQGYAAVGADAERVIAATAGNSALAAQLARYLEVRQHTLSTAHLTGMDQLFAEAEYVVKEALELRDAVIELAEADRRGVATEEHWQHVRHEIADVTLADTTMASLIPGSVTVEACIAEKTEADRGRG